MEENKRYAKYIVLPLEAWEDCRLSALDRVILQEIDSLDGDEGCFASNQYLAQFCQCSVTKVSTAISKLVELGYIYVESFNGRTRILKSRLSKIERQTFKNCKADFQKLKGAIISNIEEDNKRAITPLPPTGEDALFAEFWKAYPKKVDKKDARRVFAKIKHIDELMPKIISSLDKQKRSDQWTRDGGRYIPHPTTWLNGERWNDESEQPPESAGSFDTEDFLQAAIKRTFAGG